MKCSGKHDTTWNIPHSITFSPLHFMLYRGKAISFGTVHPPPSILQRTHSHTVPHPRMTCSIITSCSEMLLIHSQISSHSPSTLITHFHILYMVPKTPSSLLQAFALYSQINTLTYNTLPHPSIDHSTHSLTFPRSSLHLDTLSCTLSHILTHTPLLSHPQKSSHNPQRKLHLYTVPKEIDFPQYNMKCSGENVILRGIFHVVSCFPIHFMLYRRNLDYFSDSVLPPSLHFL